MPTVIHDEIKLDPERMETGFQPNHGQELTTEAILKSIRSVCQRQTGCLRSETSTGLLSFEKKRRQSKSNVHCELFLKNTFAAFWNGPRASVFLLKTENTRPHEG